MQDYSYTQQSIQPSSALFPDDSTSNRIVVDSRKTSPGIFPSQRRRREEQSIVIVDFIRCERKKREQRDHRSQILPSKLHASRGYGEEMCLVAVFSQLLLGLVVYLRALVGLR